YARRLSEVLLPAEIDSAIEGLQAPLERRVVFPARLTEQCLVCLCRFERDRTCAKGRCARNTAGIRIGADKHRLIAVTADPRAKLVSGGARTRQLRGGENVNVRAIRRRGIAEIYLALFHCRGSRLDSSGQRDDAACLHRSHRNAV